MRNAVSAFIARWCARREARVSVACATDMLYVLRSMISISGHDSACGGTAITRETGEIKMYDSDSRRPECIPGRSSAMAVFGAHWAIYVTESHDKECSYGRQPGGIEWWIDREHERWRGVRAGLWHYELTTYLDATSDYDPRERCGDSITNGDELASEGNSFELGYRLEELSEDSTPLACALADSSSGVQWSTRTLSADLIVREDGRYRMGGSRGRNTRRGSQDILYEVDLIRERY
ncbi:hypothetical protein Tco_0975573 [Tanacetum coccineum]|uniref:Uncharacterized protein n=1 Tax=Tanacetum coccineum TaxID=301880 RepID=A0ABQ5EEW4_9ASTR